MEIVSSSISPLSYNFTITSSEVTTIVWIRLFSLDFKGVLIADLVVIFCGGVSIYVSSVCAESVLGFLTYMFLFVFVFLLVTGDLESGLVFFTTGGFGLSTLGSVLFRRKGSR